MTRPCVQCGSANNARHEPSTPCMPWSTLQGQSPLHLAAFRGHANVCALLLDRGASVDARTRYVTRLLCASTPVCLHKSFKYSSSVTFLSTLPNKATFSLTAPSQCSELALFFHEVSIPQRPASGQLCGGSTGAWLGAFVWLESLVGPLYVRFVCHGSG